MKTKVILPRSVDISAVPERVRTDFNEVVLAGDDDDPIVYPGEEGDPVRLPTGLEIINFDDLHKQDLSRFLGQHGDVFIQMPVSDLARIMEIPGYIHESGLETASFDIAVVVTDLPNPPIGDKNPAE